MKQQFSQQIKKLRMKLGVSQEELALRLGISTQAVSKWECAQSYPDIELLPRIADIFQVSIDALLGHENVTSSLSGAPIEKDNVLHIVWVQNGSVLQAERFEGNVRMPLLCENVTISEPMQIEIHGNANIQGAVNGDVHAGMSVNCEDVSGGVCAGMGVNCDEVNGDVHAGTSVNCDDINGNVSAGMNVRCDCVEGDVSAAQEIKCESITGDVHATNITCDVIQGETLRIVCTNELTYKELLGSVDVQMTEM